MDFIGLVIWSGVRRLWRKALERLKECLRVILSKNLKSVACTFIHFNFLGWALLHLSYTLILIALLCLPCTIWRSFVSFFHSPLADLLSFFFFLTSLLPNLEIGKFHACVVCLALPSSLAVVPTQDFVLFFIVIIFSRKQL